jgi:hypothetical protein
MRILPGRPGAIHGVMPMMTRDQLLSLSLIGQNMSHLASSENWRDDCRDE